MKTKAIVDQVVIRVPAPGLGPEHLETVRPIIDLLAVQSVGAQGSPPGLVARAVKGISWTLHTDPDELAGMTPAHPCVACQAGLDQAVAALRDEGGRITVALGVIEYDELWAD